MIDPLVLLQAVNASNDGVLITDPRQPDNPIVFVNPVFEKLTGYTTAEVLGKNCRFLQGEERGQKEITRLRNSIKAGKACVVTLRNFRKDGTPFWNQLSVSPVRNDAGELTHFIGVQQDVTARVKAEERMREYQEKLERANKRLEELATRDALTGVFDRGYFDNALDHEWRIARRHSVSISAIMIDVDYFKKFNDAYGHQAGDRCLRAVADAISNAFRRAGDVVARYGGEEFVALLPATSAEEARQLAEGVIQDVHNLQIPTAHSEVAGHVTISAGVATLIPGPDNHPDALIHAADKALYEAKRAGRNSAVQQPA